MTSKWAALVILFSLVLFMANSRLTVARDNTASANLRDGSDAKKKLFIANYWLTSFWHPLDLGCKPLDQKFVFDVA